VSQCQIPDKETLQFLADLFKDGKSAPQSQVKNVRLNVETKAKDSPVHQALLKAITPA